MKNKKSIFDVYHLLRELLDSRYTLYFNLDNRTIRIYSHCIYDDVLRLFGFLLSDNKSLHITVDNVDNAIRILIWNEDDLY